MPSSPQRSVATYPHRLLRVLPSRPAAAVAELQHQPSTFFSYTAFRGEGGATRGSGPEGLEKRREPPSTKMTTNPERTSKLSSVRERRTACGKQGKLRRRNGDAGKGCILFTPICTSSIPPPSGEQGGGTKHIRKVKWDRHQEERVSQFGSVQLTTRDCANGQRVAVLLCPQNAEY